ncbi:MAG: toll/interleukin-1 receptor domain-containing protein [Anderseniella sp.]|jgi:hypothetical protein|nr:toll/interleukin-1 receptor domain-containing protein [Anderseniella sp.]
MANALISYSSKDRSTALEVARQLEEKGHHIWLDSKSISAGEQWDAGIAQGLSSARVLILLLSPNSVRSEYVKKEFSYASSLKLEILPVVIKSLILPEEWKFNLERKQKLFYERDPKATIDKIAKVLTSADQTLYLPGELVDTLMNDQIRIISYWLKKLVEQGSADQGDHVVFHPVKEKRNNVYIQAAKMNDGSLLLEASSRLWAPLTMDDTMNRKLLGLGWSHPARANYSRTIRIQDRNELENAANIILLTFMSVYNVNPNESIEVEHTLEA